MSQILVFVTLFATSSPFQGGLSAELHPSWSPSGTSLVFESDRYGSPDIFIWDLTTDAVSRLTDSPAHDARPVWSPDGEWIAFHSDRRGNYDIYRVRPDGTDLERVTSEELDETNVAWSPDSRTIVYELRRDEHWYLGLLELEAGVPRVLLDRPGDHLTPAFLTTDELAFSYSPPDGNHDTDITVLTIDRQGRLTGELLSGLKGNSNVNLSPALNRVAFNSIRDGDWEIYTADRDGGDTRRVTRQGGDGIVGIDGQPEWSPTADRIAITSGRAGSLDIVILRPDGTELRNLTKEWIKVPGS